LKHEVRPQKAKERQKKNPGEILGKRFQGNWKKSRKIR